MGCSRPGDVRSVLRSAVAPGYLSLRDNSSRSSRLTRPSRIAEVGRHEELLERGGSYAALWAAFAGDAELVA